MFAPRSHRLHPVTTAGLPERFGPEPGGQTAAPPRRRDGADM